MLSEWSIGLEIYGSILIAGSLLLVLDFASRIAGMVVRFLRSLAASCVGKTDEVETSVPAAERDSDLGVKTAQAVWRDIAKAGV